MRERERAIERERERERERRKEGSRHGGRDGSRERERKGFVNSFRESCLLISTRHLCRNEISPRAGSRRARRQKE